MSKFKLDPGFLPWLGIILITLALIVLQDHMKWLDKLSEGFGHSI